MTKFQWLKDYREIEDKIATLELSIERNKTELKRWVEGDLYKLKLTADSNGAKLEEVIEAAEYELAHKMNDLHNIKTLVETFDGLEHRILVKKHIEGKTLEEAAIELGYSYNYIKARHATAMKMIRYSKKVSS